MIALLMVLILSISLFTLYPTFSLALLGDDWLAFFRYFQHVGPRSPGQWNHLTYFLTPYGAQDIMMGFLQKIVGYDSTWYYLTSYILRMLAALSFYPLTNYLTKNKLAAFFAVLFFSITTIGFDTTNWSSNMTSYITVALFNLFLYCFLRSREEKRIKFFSIAAILYYLAYVTTPIRMHGSLPFIFLLELFWIFQNKNFKVAKMAALRFSIILIVFLIIRFAGQSQGPPQEPAERFMIGINTDLQMLKQGRFDFIFYPILMLGSMIIPDLISPQFPVIATRSILPLLLITFFIFSLSLFFLTKYIEIMNSKRFIQIIFTSFIWTLLIILIFKGNLNTFSSSNYIFSLLIGGYLIILSIFLLILYFKQKNVSTALFLSISWSILSFFFAWWWVPTSVFPTTYRYVIVSAIGISILLATIINLGKEKKQQRLLFASLFIIVILHIISTKMYINYLLSTHGQDISKRIWSSIPYVADVVGKKEPIIFYFEGDGTNDAILHDVVTFGFPPHMAILYNLREEDGGLPVPMSDFKDVISAVKDGKTLHAYGYPIKPVSMDQIYAFHLQGKDNLVNITQIARDKLSQITSQ